MQRVTLKRLFDFYGGDPTQFRAEVWSPQSPSPESEKRRFARLLQNDSYVDGPHVRSKDGRLLGLSSPQLVSLAWKFQQPRTGEDHVREFRASPEYQLAGAAVDASIFAAFLAHRAHKVTFKSAADAFEILSKEIF